MKHSLVFLTLLFFCLVLSTPTKSLAEDWLKYAVVLKSSGSQAKDKRQLDKCRRALAKIALSYKGTPYVWGGNTPNGFDCSGFIRAVYKHVGVDLPRVSFDQGSAGAPIQRDLRKLQTGDLIYFKRDRKSGWPHHVGMYLTRGWFIHCTRKTGVTVESLHTSKLTDSIYSITRILFTEKEGNLLVLAKQYDMLSANARRATVAGVQR